jgi:hypothetical protein
MWWNLLADAAVVVHLAYLAFIPIGGFLAWRRRWVLPLHLAAVFVGVISVTVHFDCPLTTWEQSFRRRAGGHAYTNGFVDHYLTGRLYPHGYDWVVQLFFAVCVAVAYAGLLIRAAHAAPRTASHDTTRARQSVVRRSSAMTSSPNSASVSEGAKSQNHVYTRSIPRSPRSP